MLPDDQEGRFRCYRDALRNWKYDGYVRFKKVAMEWLAHSLAEFSTKEIARMLHEFVEKGGKIDERPETRHEHTRDKFHYDLRVPIEGRRVYFETVLMVGKNPNDPDDSTIFIVSVHDV